MSSYATDAPEPVRLRFGPGTEDYVIAADVCKYLGKVMGSLFKTYPGLWRRHATVAERALLGDHVLVPRDLPIVTLLRAEEFDRIVNGDDDELKMPPLPVVLVTPEGKVLHPPQREAPAPKTTDSKTTQLHAIENYQRLPAFQRAKVKRPCNPYGKEFRAFQEANPDTVEQRSHPVLAPVNIDVEEGDIRVRDSFCWNIYEPSMPLEDFVEQMCDELEVPYAKVGPPILAQMREQISEFAEYNSASIRSAYDNPDSRITIKLHLHVGSTRLVDQFEWDLNNDDNSPEIFAQRLCADLALGGEYGSGIAHSIREQLLTYRKILVDTPHEKDELGPVAFPPLRVSKNEYWSPYLETVSEQDIEAYQKQKEREARRMRRSRRRVGEPRRSGRTGY